MQAVKIDLPRELEAATIHILADLHLGDRYADTKLIADTLRNITNNPNAYVILNGDLCNNATITSVSDTYAEKLTPMQQIAEAVSMLYPVKEKILCLTTGNHEARTYRKEGIDLTAVIARELGVQSRMMTEGGVVFLRVGELRESSRHRIPVCYTMYITHGAGGGRKEGGKINRLADLALIVDADIYIHSHTHLPAVFRGGFFRPNYGNSSVGMSEKLFINTAATLDYGGYGQTFGFKPASKVSPVLYLSGQKKEAWAKL